MPGSPPRATIATIAATRESRATIAATIAAIRGQAEGSHQHCYEGAAGLRADGAPRPWRASRHPAVTWEMGIRKTKSWIGFSKKGQEG